MEFYFIALFLLILGAIASVYIKEKNKMKVCSVISGLSAFLLAIPSFFTLFTGQKLSADIYLSPIFGNITFAIDTLSAFFVIVISFACFLGILYANGYIKPYLNKGMNTSSHTFFLMLLTASMIAVVTIQNALFFIIVWEVMSLSSLFLVIFEGNKKEVINAGIKYMIYMHISVIFIIAAFALLSIKSGSYNFADFKEVLNNTHFANIIFMLSFIGFGTKAGLLPFHNWLPDAHPAAPSHISGIMSGVMIKTGIYGILRMLYLINTPSKLIAYSVLIISTVSALWGVLYAISQHDIKRLLAYHSLENIGIIGIGIGIGILGIVNSNPVMTIFGLTGGILHVLNHAIFKPLLFFAAGSIYNKTHTRNIEQLGGLIKNMPYTSAMFIIGSVAICGLPPLNGFISEFLIYAGIISGLATDNIAIFITLIVTLASLALIGTMAILCFTKVSGVMLLGNPRSKNAADVSSDTEKIMLIPMIILAILTGFIGFFPQYAVFPVLTTIFEISGVSIPAISSIIVILKTINILFFVFLVMLLCVSLLRFVLNKSNRKHTTWGCGYNKSNNRMQYSASSYADLFISTLKPMFKRISHIKKPKDLFPKDAYFEVEIEDLEEAYIVKPLVKLDEKILSKFERIQNGNMQQYILFGLIFLVIVIVGLICIG